jgi:catechol 2,3-dioxygenase-like lactoylglutathione lyase family enzyme
MTEQSSALKPMGNIHHLALRCRDAEQTRWFYEDVLGLKLAAALALENSPGTQKNTVAFTKYRSNWRLSDGFIQPNPS